MFEINAPAAVPSPLHWRGEGQGEARNSWRDRPFSATDGHSLFLEKLSLMMDKTNSINDLTFSMTDKTFEFTPKPLFVTDKTIFITGKPFMLTNKVKSVKGKPFSVNEIGLLADKKGPIVTNQCPFVAKIQK